MNYFDKKGKPLKAGDILKYDEGKGGVTAIHEVIEVDGEMHGITRVGEPNFSLVKDVKPISLKFYCSYPYTSGVASNAELIGNTTDNPEMLTVEFASVLFDAA